MTVSPSSFVLFSRQTTESRIPGPRRDCCVSEFFLHWTILIKDFSVFWTVLCLLNIFGFVSLYYVRFLILIFKIMDDIASELPPTSPALVFLTLRLCLFSGISSKVCYELHMLWVCLVTSCPGIFLDLQVYRAASSYRRVTIIIYHFSYNFYNSKLYIKIQIKGPMKVN